MDETKTRRNLQEMFAVNAPVSTEISRQDK